MKTYDLSQYTIRSGEIIMFPITNNEVGILKQGKTAFEDYFKMPYIAGEFNAPFLEEVKNEVNMENPYWFLKSLWLVVHIKSKEIYGTLRLKKVGDINKIFANVTMLLDAQNTYSDAINLFVKFLSVNGYENILIECEKECL